MLDILAAAKPKILNLWCQSRDTEYAQQSLQSFYQSKENIYFLSDRLNDKTEEVPRRGLTNSSTRLTFFAELSLAI